MNPHEQMMRLALSEAQAAFDEGEIPVGAVIVKDGNVVARAHNLREQTGDPTAHAEILAIRQAAAYLGSRRLTGCTLYVTLEPCPMCAGAIINARVPVVVYGAKEPNFGSCGSVLNLFEERYGHHPAIYGGVLEDACTAALRTFFSGLRG